MKWVKVVSQSEATNGGIPLFLKKLFLKVMQIEKALINDCLRVWKVSWKFPTPIIFALIYL